MKLNHDMEFYRKSNSFYGSGSGAGLSFNQLTDGMKDLLNTLKDFKSVSLY